MYELKNGETGEVLATDKNYSDIMDTAGFYLSLGCIEVWFNGEFIEEV